jgi:hypothetical protein
MTTISPSLFILAWMAVISCIMRPVEAVGPFEALTLVASVVSSLLAMLSEAGAIESENEGGKKPLDVILQVFALAAFLIRVAAFCWLRA